MATRSTFPTSTQASWPAFSPTSSASAGTIELLADAGATLSLQDPVTVTHQGRVIVFARGTGPTQSLSYQVRAGAASSGGLVKADTWMLLALTGQAGADGGTPPSTSVRLLGASVVSVPIGTQAATPADAPFSVVSDGEYVDVFRPTVQGTLYLDRFVLVEKPGAANPDGTQPPSAFELQRAWESRYQRSGKRDTPASSTDTMGVASIDGIPFVEPTFELALTSFAAAQKVAILLVPTADGKTQRWHFFYVDTTGDVRAWSFLRTPNGLFDLSLGTLTNFMISLNLLTGTSAVAQLTPSAGAAAAFFAERESMADSAGAIVSVQRGARIMLVVPATGTALTGGAGLAIYDFSVGLDGKVPPFDGEAGNVVIDGGTQSTGYAIPANAMYDLVPGTVAAYAMGLATPSGTPVLLDSGDGLVHCYFNDAATSAGVGSLTVAQYDPAVTRAACPFTWQVGSGTGAITGAFQFVAKRAGTTMNGISVTLTPNSAAPTSYPLCDVSVDYGSASGIASDGWQNVPGDLATFQSVLDGSASPTAASLGVQTSAMPFYDYTGTRSLVRLPLGDATTPTGLLTLVSARADIQFASAVTTVTSSTATLTVNLTAGSVALSQSWTSLPTDSAIASSILNGDSATQSYYANAGTNLAFGLDVGSGTLLVFCNTAGGMTTTTPPLPQLSIAKATDGNADHCDVTLTVLGGSGPYVAPNVRRSQAHFISDITATTISSNTLAAMLAYVSPGEDGAGVVVNQTSLPLTLRELSGLFDVLPVNGDGELVAATTTAIKQGPTGSQTGHGLTAAAVVRVGRPPVGETAFVQSSGIAVTASVVATNGTWLVAPQTQALSLASGQAVTIANPGNSLVPTPDWTIEAWVNQQGGGDQQIISYVSTADTNIVGGAASYSLATTTAPGVEFAITAGQTSMPSVSLPSIQGALPSQFTWECWVKPASQVVRSGDARAAVIGQFWFTDRFSYTVDFLASGQLEFTAYATNGAALASVTTTAPLSANTWAHIAVTAQLVGSSYTVQLFVNGVLSASATGWTFLGVSGLGNFLAIGASGVGQFSGDTSLQTISPMNGSVANVRYWNVCRTQDDIVAFMRKRLTGNETGLLGDWRLNDYNGDGSTATNFAATTGHANNGTYHGSSPTLQPDANGPLFQFYGAVYGNFQAVADPLLDPGWNHVALAVEHGSAINLVNTGLAAPQYVECGNPDAAQVPPSFSIDAWIGISAMPASDQVIVAKSGGQSNQPSYMLAVNSGGTLTFSVTPVVNGVTQDAVVLVGKRSVVGAPVRVMATFASSATNTTCQGLLSVYVYGGLDTSMSTPVYTPASGGTPAMAVLSSASPLTIGALLSENVPSATFNGMITGVRLWNTALNATQVVNVELRGSFTDAKPVAAWWFAEQSGRITYDSVAEIPARLSSDTLWCKTVVTARNSFYVNGVLATTTAISPDDYYADIGATTSQCLIGGCISNSSTLANANGVQLAELRLWNVARSAGEIAGGMYRRAAAFNPALAAYWQFDNGLTDASGNGNDGTGYDQTTPSFVPSGAPVWTEGPAVTSLYGGNNTAFQLTLTGSPAVVEYPEVQRDPNGQVQAVYQRGYVSLGSTIQSATPYRVGELELTYLGQVQTGASLVGFIEGPPPVPSENLALPFDHAPNSVTSYFNTSTVQLTETDAELLTISTSDTSGSGYDLSAAIGAAGDTEVGVGIGAVALTIKASAKAGAKSKRSEATSATSGQAPSTGVTTTFTDSLGVRGRWETRSPMTGNYLDRQVGRRFIPDNCGYALVESMTADLYGMRARNSSAVLGTVAVPNIDIPRDRNVIVFPISSTYTKNGTLDGKVGLQNDEDYPNADQTRGSYFKPKEAYRLRDEIRQDWQDATSYLAQFNATQAGESKDTGLTDVMANQAYDWQEKRAALGLVNTYVWTAAGGLHAEEEQSVAVMSTSYSGSYSLTRSVGPAAEFSATVGVGVYGSVDLLFNRQVNVSVGTTNDSTEGFGLSVSVTGESLLQQWDHVSQQYLANLCPGKVDAYRFMSYYLPPSVDNATAFASNVIDQQWLRRSNDPNAVVLRAANLSNPAWRVLHRVTYVSRVPPTYDTNPDLTTAPEPLQAVNTADNTVLIQLVVNQLAGAPPTAQNVGAAISALLEPAAGTVSLFTLLVPWWSTLLTAARQNSASAQAAFVREVCREVFAFVMAAAATNSLTTARS